MIHTALYILWEPVISNLAGLWAVWVELDLFNGKFSARVSIVTEEDPTKSSLTQQLSQAPVCGGTRSYTYQNTLGETIHVTVVMSVSALDLQNIAKALCLSLIFKKKPA